MDKIGRLIQRASLGYNNKIFKYFRTSVMHDFKTVFQTAISCKNKLQLMLMFSGGFFVGNCSDRNEKQHAIYWAKTGVGEVAGLVFSFIIDNGRYPVSVDEAVNYSAHGSSNPKIAIDPWGNPYIISIRDGKFKVWSLGPNLVDNGGEGDDICSDTFDASEWINRADQK